MTSRHYGRSTRRARTIRANVKAQAATAGASCVECGQPIDYGLEPNHPDAFTMAHELPVATHPHLAEEPANIKGPAHRRCNSAAGTSTGVGLSDLGLTSTEW